MPSLRSPRRLRPTSKRAAGLLAVLLAACTTAAPPPPRAPERPRPATLDVVTEEEPYLLDPLAGYGAAGDAGRRQAVTAAHAALLRDGDVAAARRAAAELLAAEPGFAPAAVLMAQADHLENRWPAVVERLLPLGDAQPTYTASQLLLGRAAERAEDPALAYAAYRAVASRNPLAFERTGVLHPGAVGVVSERLRNALRSGDLETARGQLALLREWAPAEAATLEATRDLAVAAGDRQAELAALRDLGRRARTRELLERQADLEFEVGDPGAGLAIAQEIAAEDPADAAAADRLAAAKFRWRVTLLPPGVRAVAAKPDLDRAELAVLLYWLVPDIRYGRPSSGRIATDVLDHPQREEIVRVVNLGLLDVDSTLHRFSPRASARRSTALRSLTRLLARSGNAGDIPCLKEAGGGTSQGGLCAQAARCGLVPAEEECLPGEGISGTAMVEMIRRTLALLGRS